MPQLVDITLPASEEPAAEAVVSQWLKKVGDAVALHEPLLEVNTDKVVLEVPSPAAGVLCEILKKEGDAAGPEEVLGRIEKQAAEGSAASPPESAGSAAQGRRQGPAAAPETRLSPAVRRLVKESGLDPSRIRGSGRGGRVTFQDARAHLRKSPAQTSAPAAAQPAPTIPSPSVQPVLDTGTSRRQPHTPMRRSIAAHMLESVRTAPHVTAVFEADFTAVQRSRASQLENFLERGVRLTYTAYLVAGAAQALQTVPEINSRWHEDSLEIFADCNIGVATALGRSGLVAPVIRRAQDLDLFGIASRLQELTELARQGRLKSEHLEGGTFTLTNHGVSGSLIATPILHQPQSAILGVGKVQKRVVVSEIQGEDCLKIRPMAYVTLTVDHRGVDGFTANEFLSRFVEVLETWA